MTKYKLFPINELFVIRGVKKKIRSEDLIPGEYNYITTSNKNFGFSGNHIEYCEEPMVFTVDSATDGKAFLQTERFIGSDHVEILEPLQTIKSKISIESGLYIQTLLNAFLDKYEYSRKRAQIRLEKESILLPVKNDEIDWQYMEKYIKKVKDDIVWRLPSLLNNNEENNDFKYKVFKFEDVFILKKGKRLTKTNMVPGLTNFIGAISDNNGIRETIGQAALFEGNAITVNYNGSVGEAFYQTEPFWASDDVNVLYLKKGILNFYIAMYLITVIKANRVNFDYGRKWNLEKMRLSQLRLPINADESPDWEKMEQYVKSLLNMEFVI